MPTDRRPDRRRSLATNVVSRGEPMLWTTAAALLLGLAMVVGLLTWIAYRGLPTFWPSPVVKIATVDGREFVGEVTETEEFRLGSQMLAGLDEPLHAAAVAAGGTEVRHRRRQLRTGNFELTGTHFTWIADFEIADEERPEQTIVVERLEWGRFYGEPTAFARLQPTGADGAGSAAPTAALAGSRPAVLVQRSVAGLTAPVFVAPTELRDGERPAAIADVIDGREAAWEQFEARHAAVLAMRAEAERLREHDVGEVNRALETARLRVRQAEIDFAPSPAWTTAQASLRAAQRAGAQAAIDAAAAQLEAIEADFGRPAAAYLAAVAEAESIEVDAAVRYDELTERIAAIEEEARREVLLFDTAQGVPVLIPLAEIVRAYPANRLGALERTGVYVDRWWEYLTAEPREANTEGGIFPAIFGTVLMTLLMCLVVVPFGVLAALYLREYAKAGPIISTVRIAVNNLAGVPSIVFGVFGLGFFCYIVGASIDDLFFEARLPQPTFGKGGLLWASLTLALMTAPVVIVATEEALSAVPNSMREGSYACGASRWQTIQRIVLPRAMPGILTGAILAMARGAGEVAPLMLVGAVKLAPELPIDTVPPFGVNQSFMHLGFHIYDLGFQSQNSEAAKPMVYTTTLLLIGLVAVLNIAAIRLRSRLRRRFVSSAF